MFGVYKVEIDYVSTGEGDYRKWLGPDWKPQWEKTGTLVLNHVSFMDILFSLVYFFPSFVSKDSVKNYPMVGNIAIAIDSLFLNRAGTKEEKIAMGNMIQERQLLNEKTERAPILIFPEGATTNNNSIINFKRGPFAGFHSVQPVCMNYTSINGISTQNDTLFHFHYYYCNLSYGTTLKMKVYPVFKPNEYFWQHHYDKSKGMEKWEVYAKVVREEIMAKSFDFKVSSISMEQKFAFKNILKGTKQRTD
uniref:Phospholipid/glycerol acyltransferase domain-containing protein n=1 Tax=Strombidium rassoulzadegani TaxID=1082188 RepID=A0A7S3CKT5_9SPIT|mmetsp:Transcript_14108/g.23957  ORF Transcript_14108/g.23957 Transcript_14108/m.23957 type:complete len:249 (+) Transcript_14108:380-1126(+)